MGVACALVLGCTAGEQEEGPDDCGDLCVEPDPVRVGATLALSGPLEPYGRAQLAGMERAVEETERAGGLLVGVERRQVELLVRDDRGDASIAGQWLLILIRLPEPVQALLGPCSATLTAVRVAEAREVPLLRGCAPGVTDGQPGTWQHGPTEAERAQAVLAAVGAGGPVAVFLSPGHDAGAWTAAASAAQVTLLGPFRPEGAGRRTSWADAVGQAAGAQAVVAVTDPPDGDALRRDLQAARLRPDALFASEAALTGSAARAWAPLAPDVLTDLVADEQAVEDAVASAAAEVTRALLDAVGTTGSARRDEIGAALAAADLHRPYRLARVSGDELEPLPP